MSCVKYIFCFDFSLLYVTFSMSCMAKFMHAIMLGVQSFKKIFFLKQIFFSSGSRLGVVRYYYFAPRTISLPILFLHNPPRAPRSLPAVTPTSYIITMMYSARRVVYDSALRRFATTTALLTHRPVLTCAPSCSCSSHRRAPRGTQLSSASGQK